MKIIFSSNTSIGLIATFVAPLVGAVVVRALTSLAGTALYNDVKSFRDAVDWIGDGINKIVMHLAML